MTEPTYIIAEMMKELCTELKGIAEGIMAGNRPSAGKEKDSFIVVRTSSNIGDHWAYQQMSVYVQIFVRNLQGGLPDYVKLERLSKKVIEHFPYVSYDKKHTNIWKWKASTPTLQITGDDNLGFSAWLLRSSAQVNTTDRFASWQEPETNETENNNNNT